MVTYSGMVALIYCLFIMVKQWLLHKLHISSSMLGRCYRNSNLLNSHSLHEYRTWKNFGGEKIVLNLANRDLFAKIFLTNIHRYTETVFGICIDCSLFAKFFPANSFYLYGSPKFSLIKDFPCTVHSYL